MCSIPAPTRSRWTPTRGSNRERAGNIVMPALYSVRGCFDGTNWHQISAALDIN
jgi:hypothetical protein